MGEERQSLIIPSQLSSAREFLGLTREEVARRVGIDPEQLTRWETGHSEPSVEQLWELADLYHCSTDYFLVATAPLPDELHFRSAQHLSLKELSLEVRQVLADFEELCRTQTQLERLLGRERRVDIPKLSQDLSPENMAQVERERLGLAEKPIKGLRNLLANQGIRIFELPVKENKENVISGLSWWHEEYGPCILVNARDNPGRRTFTLAHEYAHLLRSDPPMVCDLRVDVVEERSANTFAAAFLMPTTPLGEEFVTAVPQGELPDDRQLGRLARRWAVSLEALGRRLEELELVPRGFTNSRIAEWQTQQRPYRRSKSPTWRRRLGEEFVSLALRAHSEGYISLGKLARYFGRDIRDVMEEVGKAQVGGTSRRNA